MFGIGKAVKIMRNGGRVAREGWNAKNMHTFLISRSTFDKWGSQTAPGGILLPVVNVEVKEYVALKTANGEIVPWNCSQSDLLAVDWFELEELT